jgi:hypothetical protein
MRGDNALEAARPPFARQPTNPIGRFVWVLEHRESRNADHFHPQLAEIGVSALVARWTISETV